MTWTNICDTIVTRDVQRDQVVVGKYSGHNIIKALSHNKTKMVCPDEEPYLVFTETILPDNEEPYSW